MSAVREIITGVKALRDWLGDTETPVHPIVADMRAARCVEGFINPETGEPEPCPMNKAPKWWEKAKEVAANWIRKELEIKSRMNLRVAQEDRLHMCKACGCCLPLKIWAPPKYVRKHLTEEIKQKMPAYCWQLKDANP